MPNSVRTRPTVRWTIGPAGSSPWVTANPLARTANDTAWKPTSTAAAA